MRPLHRFFGSADSDDGASTETGVEPQPWNTLLTLQSGAVADVDSRGSVYLRRRPVSVEVWFGHGERWIRGTAGDGVRQTRVDGLPIIETRQKLEEGDITQTAWADEAGDGQGRVVVELSNDGQVSIVAAIVVRPRRLLGDGSITTARVADSLVVIDGVPLVDLGREPGAVVTAVDSPDASGLLDQLNLADTTIEGARELDDDGGHVSIAAIIPLARGAKRQIEILDGREPATVQPAPLDTVRTGWKTHLSQSAIVDLPGWPNHLPTALISSLLGSTASTGRPLGDASWSPIDDSIRAVALARAGFGWASAHVADDLLSEVTEGRIGREDWAAMAAVIAAITTYPEGVEVLERHADAVAAVAGHALSRARHENLVQRLVLAIGHAHGSAAAQDAATIEGSLLSGDDAVSYCRHGVGVASEHSAAIEAALAERAATSAEMIGLSMGASSLRPFEPIVPVRSLAGSTWRWQRSGCGDSPHGRAALFVGLTSLAAVEQAGTAGTTNIDLFAGATSRWLGQKVSFTSMPTIAGRLSAAVRWHGERAALLWEFEDDAPAGVSTTAFAITSTRLDATFISHERSGEALLSVPEALVAERDAAESKSAGSLL